jgi:hypothetical protein
MTELSDVDTLVTADHLLGEKSSIIDARNGQQHHRELCTIDARQPRRRRMDNQISTKPRLNSEYWSLGVRQHRIDSAAKRSVRLPVQERVEGPARFTVYRPL